MRALLRFSASLRLATIEQPGDTMMAHARAWKTLWGMKLGNVEIPSHPVLEKDCSRNGFIWFTNQSITIFARVRITI